MEYKVYKLLKEIIEVIALVSACFAFIAYLADEDERDRSDQLKTLQLSQLCQSLSSTVDGTQVWNYQKPRTQADLNQENKKIDERISFLNENCIGVPYYIPPTRTLDDADAHTKTD